MEKEFVKDGLKTDDIINTVKKIRETIENNPDKLSDEVLINNLKKEFNFFSERYPLLFELSTRTNEPFNWEYLNFFLMMRNKIIDNELTNDKASVIVGQEWFNKHVKLPPK